MEQGRKKKSGETLGLFGPAKNPLKYSSASTRSTSLQGFMGGAEFDEINTYCKIPTDDNENLEKKFKSGANRTDLPSMYGPANVTRKLVNFRLSNEDAIAGWVRKKRRANQMSWMEILVWVIANEPKVLEDLKKAIVGLKGQPNALEVVRTILNDVIEVVKAIEKP